MRRPLIRPMPRQATKRQLDFDYIISFNTAFATAREEGWPQFIWHGKTYTTRRKDDTKTLRGY